MQQTQTRTPLVNINPRLLSNINDLDRVKKDIEKVKKAILSLDAFA